MRLKEVILKNFRCYKEVRIPIDETLTGFIGKNDSGKSTILEALEIFFNNSLVKIDSSDLCIGVVDQPISISCIFTDLPEEITIDESAKTTLKDEYLLNENGFLEIQKEFDCSKKTTPAEIYCIALHPCEKDYKDLLSLKNSDLKTRISNLGIDSSLESNVIMRKSIWQNQKDLKKEMIKLQLNKEDGKKIWDKLQNYLPLYALFQSDRKSTDEDSEVQDPMKIAIQEAIRSVESQLETIRNEVKTRVEDVAKRTIDKLKEMDESLAETLSPNFSSDPKWEGFKFSLTSGDQIPINKRGSGVRRLILLNFFRAEAERKRIIKDSSNVIYAVEEPETSQHPDNQIKIINALNKLAQDDKCQVLVTTHVPGLAGFLDVNAIRYVKQDNKESTIESNPSEDFISKIADDIGVVPDERVKIIIFVEGPNDIQFLTHLGNIANKYDKDFPNLGLDKRIVLIPLGGSTLKEWVSKRYLKPFDKPELYLFDKDSQKEPKYKTEADAVNSRGGNSKAIILEKLEMENYIHPDAIKAEYQFEISFNDFDDLPMLVAQKVHENSNSGKSWNTVEKEDKKEKERKAKLRLNNECMKNMTWELFCQMDNKKEFEKIFIYINKILKPETKEIREKKGTANDEEKTSLFN